MEVNYKKIAAFFLSLGLIGIFFYSTGWAQTSQKSIQEQIVELLKEVALLESQLSGLQGESFQFNRDLRQGDSGEDVRELQEFLNTDPETLVASSGPGSSGQETKFFGPATFSAVKKFQQKYASKVLNPLGLSSPTGFVGLATRTQLNSLRSSSAVGVSEQLVEDPTQPSQSTFPLNQLSEGALPENFDFAENFFFVADAEEPMPTLVSRTVAEPGSQITLYGSGFMPDENTVNFNKDISISGLSSTNNAIKFNIPTDIPPGPYDLTVTNSKGDSITSVFLVVRSYAISASPTVSQVIPSEGRYGTEITIEGSGFTSVGNQVRSSYGNIDNLNSPDGRTLKFKVEPFPETPNLDKVDELNEGIEWPIHFFVANGNGISSESGVFTLNF